MHLRGHGEIAGDPVDAGPLLDHLDGDQAVVVVLADASGGDDQRPTTGPVERRPREPPGGGPGWSYGSNDHAAIGSMTCREYGRCLWPTQALAGERLHR